MALPITCACNSCGYDLCGMAATWADSTPLAITCSECGHTMDSATVLSERRLEPRWSFEHGTRGRVRRFAGTALRLAFPVFLWRGLPRGTRLHPIRLAVFVFLLAGLCYACVGALSALSQYQSVTTQYGMMGSVSGTLPFNTLEQLRAVATAAAWPEQNFQSLWGILLGWGAIALLGAMLIPVFLAPFWLEITRRGGGPTALLRGAAYQLIAIVLSWSMLSYLDWNGHLLRPGPWSSIGPAWSFSGVGSHWNWASRATVFAFLAWTLVYWWSFINDHARLPRGGLVFCYAIICGFGASTILLLRASGDLPRIEVGCFLADVFGQPPTAQD